MFYKIKLKLTQLNIIFFDFIVDKQSIFIYNTKENCSLKGGEKDDHSQSW